MPEQVMICGNDEHLLHTRQLVLEKAGMYVEVAVGIEMLRSLRVDPSCQLAILGHSLKPGEQEEVIDLLRGQLPFLPILVLTSTLHEQPSGRYQVLDVREGPIALIAKSKAMIAESETQESVMKPSEYRNTFVVMQDVSYRVIEDKEGGVLPKTGTLGVGRVVWLPDPDKEKALDDAQVVAYAENIGMVSVSRNSLARAT
jgi:hypothetical protein